MKRWMRSKGEKAICGLVMLCLTVSMTAACGSANKKDVSTETDEVKLKVVSAERLEQAENADVASVSFDLLCQSNPAQVESMIDGGTTLVVNHVSQEEISELADQFSLDFYPAENNALQRTYAAVLRKSLTGEIQIVEYIAEIAKKCGISKPIDPSEEEVGKTLSWVCENEELDMKNTAVALQALDQESRRKVEDVRGNASMQNSFAHVCKHYDLYASTTEQDKLASVDLTLLLLEEKTQENATIDSAFAACQVSGHAPNKTKIKEYHVKLEAPASSQYVLYPIRLDSDSSQDVVNNFSEQHSKWWKVTPASPVSGDAYSLSPIMVVEKKDGKTVAGTVKATFSYIKVKQGLLSSWVSDVDKVIAIHFKNHQNRV